ncbi:hypothetical protein MPDQ_003839 [Monascus purpureus]|uniref:Nitrate/nitrite transporter n=1 Tax=Monascus purpureus TaxID=5098 RepID=A0A507R2R1_MONPU|nr:hypothetical protein MPDQ_003839 [Monascus purpureus]BDD59811.1 hypothetical protein MAP00_004998 [Monascus purpureus]
MSLGPLKLLFVSPEVNPINKKAKSIPILNPIDPYGRVFFFSWLGFMVAFLSWYAFPPLMTDTIKQDLHMSQDDVANSNIIALLATLLVRLFCGPLCDRYGPRLVFVGLLLCGAIPTALAGLVFTPKGLIALRFFVGILGATFVPCQVWCTGFFDRNIVGSANSLAGGFGNAGGGITYFVMPAIYNSLVHSRGLTPHRAWRVAYVVPFIIIAAIALTMLFTCPDTPTGKWSERHTWVGNHASDSPAQSNAINITDTEKKAGTESPDITSTDQESKHPEVAAGCNSEAVVDPTLKDALRVTCSLSTISLALTYACSFGSELSINSILGAFYAKNFPKLGQTRSGDWAAMFGLLNVVCRPTGGFVSDLLYRSTGTVWSKKIWLIFLGVVMGVFELAIGLTDPKDEATMFGLMAGLAFFLEACNGANFALVPHAHPFANGIVSGIVGGMGNFGGIIFAIVFRYNGVQYGRSFWIIGVICIGINVLFSWTRPGSKLNV